MILWLTKGSVYVFFSSRRRHTRYWRDWSSDVCSSDLALVADHLQRLYDVSGALLLLDLLRNEPLQESLARVIVLPDRQPVEMIYHRSDLALVFERALEYLQRRAELDDRLLYRLQNDPAVAVQDEVVELHRVLSLLLRLSPHPMREA